MSPELVLRRLFIHFHITDFIVGHLGNSGKNMTLGEDVVHPVVQAV